MALQYILEARRIAVFFAVFYEFIGDFICEIFFCQYCVVRCRKCSTERSSKMTFSARKRHVILVCRYFSPSAVFAVIFLSPLGPRTPRSTCDAVDRATTDRWPDPQMERNKAPTLGAPSRDVLPGPLLEAQLPLPRSRRNDATIRILPVPILHPVVLPELARGSQAAASAGAWRRAAWLTVTHSSPWASHLAQ